MLTTTFMACECKKIVSPAMNTRMFNNPVVKDNMKKLESYGIDAVSYTHLDVYKRQRNQRIKR